MSLAKFSVENTVLINMMVVIIFITGIITVIMIPKEASPDVDFGAALIVVNYPGVSPDEIENLIVKKIEDQIKNLDNLDHFTSTSQEGRANIRVSFDARADSDKSFERLVAEMAKITDLPVDAHDPIITQLRMRELNSMCDVSLFGNFSGNSLREISENLRDEIQNLRFISKVEIHGTRDRQIHINVDMMRLNHFGLTLSDISNSLQLRNMNVPGGAINFGKSEFIIRTMGEFQTVQDIRDLVLRSDEFGRMIRISDVATVEDTLEKEVIISKLDGLPSVNLQVYKKNEGNVIDVMKNVRRVATEFEGTVPGLTVVVRNDDSIDVRKSVNNLGQSAMMGILLVFTILWIFIGWRNAILAAWGIPFSFMITFIILYFTDITLNNMSLFALVLVLGLLVDVAIVVIENVFRHVEKGLTVVEATIIGADEVSLPVFAAVVTTIAAFLPILMVEGRIGRFIGIFPIVVTIALIASLFQCLFFLPAHISQIARKKAENPRKEKHFYENVQKKYRVLLQKVLLRRHWAIAITTVIVIFSGYILLYSGLIKFDFFPRRSATNMTIRLRTPVGTPLDQTNLVVSQIENYILNMPERSDITAIVTNVGQLRENRQWRRATSNAEMRIEFLQAEELTHSVAHIRGRIREFLNELPGLYTYNFTEGRGGPPVGLDLEVRVRGDELHRLEQISEYIMDEVSKLPGVVDIENTFSPGKEEIRIKPKHDKLAIHGISVSQIASLIRVASFGSTIAKFRGGGVQEFDIVLRAEDVQIDNFDDLKLLKIRNRFGNLIQLDELCEFVITKGYAEINHYDGRRCVTITGGSSTYIDERGRTRKRTANEINEFLFGNKVRRTEGVLSDFNQRFPGYTIEAGGMAEDQRRSYNSLFMALGICLSLMYAVLATQFKSYIMPVIVMLTIPFGVVGVTLGLYISNLPFSLNTMISVIALAGVVINNSLVMVDFIKRERINGKDKWISIISASSIRLRAIILTTVTSIGGLMPMILSKAEAVADWKPMAVSICYGLALATILTLFIIPCAFSYVDSFFEKRKMTDFGKYKALADINEDDFS
jgi:multidrug efflux pump subunit AcrB